MRKLATLLSFSLVAAGVLTTAACQRQDEETQKKLDYLISKVEGLEKKVQAGGGGARPAVGAPGQPQQPPRPQRPAPDAAAAYSIDVTGSPFKGPANAKVTIVEAAEFA